jgi:glycosyltransferase involved in cell wall biosynthesis
LRILIANLSYTPDVIGGAEVAVRTLAHALVVRGCQVTVVCLSSRGIDWGYDDDGVQVRFLAAHPMGNLLMEPNRTLPQKVLWQLLADYRGWSHAKIAGIVAQQQPDVVNTHNLVGLSTSAWDVAQAAGVPAVHTLHGYQLLCPFGTMLSKGKPCTKQCWSCRLVTIPRRWSKATPPSVVANSQYTLKMHLEAGYFRDSRHYVVANPTSSYGRAATRVLGPPVAPNSPAHLPSRAQSEVAPMCIGYLGRLIPYKGVDLLLDALSLVPRHLWRAKIAGTGTIKYERKLRERLKGLGLPIELLGSTPQDRFFPQIDLLVIPSIIAEPQGLGIYEAAGYGIPAVYANHGGLAELAATMPGTVPFVANSARDLARVIGQFLRQPAKLSALQHSAASQVLPIDPERYGKIYMQIFAEACSRGTGPGVAEPSDGLVPSAMSTATQWFGSSRQEVGYD